MGTKPTAVFFFLLYLVLLILMMTNQNMLAMWVMTIGMFLEAALGLYTAFKRH